MCDGIGCIEGVFQIITIPSKKYGDSSKKMDQISNSMELFRAYMPAEWIMTYEVD